jgi:hypothetical protein
MIARLLLFLVGLGGVIEGSLSIVFYKLVAQIAHFKAIDSNR